MAATQNTPHQPFADTGRFDWQSEETLVDRRNRLPNRIRRFLRSGLLWKVLLGLFVIGLFSAPFMEAVLTLFGMLISISLFMMTIVVQFVAIFWFLARSRIYEVYPGAEGVSFADYRGQPELLEQAQQIVMLLRGVKAFENAGGEPLNGLLLEGPPGTGKTWMAKAISTEAGVPFFYVDTSSLQGMFIGTSSLKVMQVYGKARKAAKEFGAAVVFLDEIDSVGSRGGVSSVGGGGGNSISNMGGMGGDMGLLSTLLVQMSGFSQEHGWRPRLRSWFYKTILRRKPPTVPKRVLTIGATNRAQALDAALLRPGRFDKKIRVDVPDMEGRREIIEYYLTKFAHDSSVDPAILATETPGYSPADIKYLLNDALRYALFDGRRYITYKDFRLAQPEHEMGLRAPLKHLSQEARRRMAYYQAGRAVAIRLFLPIHRITRISIIRQGFSYGHVWHYPAREVYPGMPTRDELLNQARAEIAGKAAEIEFLGVKNQSMGGGDDFRKTVNRIWRMTDAGMFGPLGGAMTVTYDPLQGPVTRPTKEQAEVVEEQYQRILLETRSVLRENGHIIHTLAELLLREEEMLAEEVRDFFDQYGLFTPDPVAVRDGIEFQLGKRAVEQLPPGEPASADAE